MRKYLAILRIGWLDAIEYRTEFFVGVIGWGIRLFIALFLWLAVAKANGGTIGDYTFQSILIYFFIVQIISTFIFARVGFDIAYDIYRGDFANFLLKPINYILFRFIHQTSKNAFRVMLGIIIFGSLLVAFFGGVPLTLWKIPLALIGVAGAYILNFCMVCIIAFSAFWITNATRLNFIYFGILMIFSGAIVPIDLFPPHYYEIISKLPFYYIFYFPAKIIQASAYDPMIAKGLLIQFFYVIAIGTFMIFMYRRGVKRFEAVGR